MNESKSDVSRYERFAPKVLAINGCTALGFVLIAVLMGGFNPPVKETWATVILVPVGVTLWFWCFFCLPVSTMWVAIASARRLKERKTRMVQLYCLLLMMFWVLLFFACLL